VGIRTSRSRRSNLVAVGSCLAVYVVFAVFYHWARSPTVAKDFEQAAKAPPVVTVWDRSDARLALPASLEPAPAPSEPSGAARLASPAPSLTAPAPPEPSTAARVEPATPTPATAPLVLAATPAPESEPAAPPVEKTVRRTREVRKHLARSAPRRERPVRQVRERRNPWDFAWGQSSYRNRPWF
jgi:hypothetical protein